MVTKVLLVSLALFALGTCQVAVNLCTQYGWPNGNYPDPYDCRKYISCNGAVATVMSCALGTVFNPNTRNCDAYGNVPICQYALPSPIVVTNICNQYGWGNGNFYHPYNCAEYIGCANGLTTVNACGAGQYYDQALGRCALAGTGYCRQYVFTPPPAPVVYPDGFDTYCSANNLATGIHPDPYSCFSYVECTFGRTTHMPCPAGLSFDRSLLVCDGNRYQNCGGNVLVGK
uniref:25 kDa polyphenol-binding protein n=1 Tax=Aplysia kurodai TaxID=6501 RepID=A0A1B4XTR1_APLKU|nr:Chain A, kDa polyphenol-binding protein [Aplysia kurodai]8IN4_A Chain A, kDa polyphenol-binding protein [Aplysia kurodai]8IN6_A Chain A, kDa polyphenol-binding protein [Aplysia kurodai]BAV38197.1 25 kDa polyphenol-binding protein [Aplysia kurodai]